MISGIDASAQRFLHDVGSARARQSKAQNQISSGYRLNRPSDNPDEVARLISLQSDLDRAGQVETNLGLYKVETDSAEKALASAVDVLDRLSVIASQGTSPLMTEEKREILARDAQAWLERLVSIANTSVNGRYVFAGDSDQTIPYSLDLTQTSGVSAYAGTAATRQAEDLSGGRFAVAKSADQIFDDPAASVFGAANALRVALADNDPEAIDASLVALAAAREHLNQQHAEYGSIQSRIAAEIAAVDKRQLQLKEQVTGIRETDLMEASVALVSAETQINSALAARSRQPSTSLFDYLG